MLALRIGCAPLGVCAALIGCGQWVSPPQNQFGFSAAIDPVTFNPATDTAYARSGRALERASDCAGCHQEIYRNWYDSRHRVAFTNPLYQQSHAREPLTWCVNCHAPLQKPGAVPTDKTARILPDEGISCQVCHVRRGRILVSEKSRATQLGGTAGKPAHEYEVVKGMADADFCGNCHQFSFPTIDSTARGKVRYSALPMQDTVSEWRGSSFGPRSSAQFRGSCVSCHLEAGTSRSHRFSGGHDLKRLAMSLHVQGRRVDRRSIELIVTSIGIGHRFPTGDLFRSLEVTILDGKKRVAGRVVLRREYGPATVQDASAPSRSLIADTALPAPTGNEPFASRSFLIQLHKELEPLSYEMRIGYVEDVFRLIGTMSESKTHPMFKRGPLPMLPAREYTPGEG